MIEERSVTGQTRARCFHCGYIIAMPTLSELHQKIREHTPEECAKCLREQQRPQEDG